MILTTKFSYLLFTERIQLFSVCRLSESCPFLFYFLIIASDSYKNERLKPFTSPDCLVYKIYL